jgi:hypothetical protein
MEKWEIASMLNCSDCKHAVKIDEREYECAADQYDIDNKTCYVPRGLDDADETAFRDINRISANADFMSELLK